MNWLEIISLGLLILGVYKYQNSVYRTYDGGIAKINENLEIMTDTKLGDYNPLEVYSTKVIGDNIYFGLSDFSGFDEVAIIDSDGNEAARYTVGAIPGDFAVWSSCSNNGDVNLDDYLNVVDIILIVSSILDEEPYNCISDMNNDSIVNISDIILLIQIILN